MVEDNIYLEYLDTSEEETKQDEAKEDEAIQKPKLASLTITIQCHHKSNQAVKRNGKDHQL